MRVRFLLEWCAVLAITLAIAAMLGTGRTTVRADNIVYDFLVGLSAPPVSDRILLVAIDDASMATLGRWPWSRDIHARLLDQLARAQPAAVAYDVLFTEPGTAEEDRHFAQSIERLGNVSLPVLFETPGTDGRVVDAVLPVPAFAQSARNLGQVALIPDEGGVARSVPLTFSASGREWVHLMEHAYRTALGHPSPVFQRLADRNETFATIPFQPGTGAFRTASFSSVLAGEVPSDFIEDRIVLVGATAAGLGDRFRVPNTTGALSSGVELQANLLNSLLADRAIDVPGNRIRTMAAVLPAFFLLVSFWWLRPSGAFSAWIATLVLALAIPAALLVTADIWIPPTPALAGLVVAYPLWSWRRLQTVDRAIAKELDALSKEETPLGSDMSEESYLDPIGGQTARLQSAISEMRDLRRLVSDTIDSVVDPILVTDNAGQTVLANRAARSLLAAPGDDNPLRAWLGELEGNANPDDEDLVELRLGNGKTYTRRHFPLRNHSGEQRGWILQLADISEIRRAQRERDEMLEFLSHDMRSPQSSIIMLLEKHQAAIEDKALVERIQSLARKTLRLSDDFVQMARFSAVSFDPEEVELCDLLMEAADELWPFASSRNVKVEIDRSAHDLFIEAERDSLSRAFVNLLHNAIKFSPESGLVRCSVKREGDRIECSIEDDGPGMPAARRDAPFARFGKRLGRNGGGGLSAGLGLAYVAAAIEHHNGTIAYEARQPHGTRVTMTFSAID
ncbi:CHASE2 domain-containing protein [Pelagerythrobacter marensis]|uniref:histidine kinase n=1 Tax=Pelagerythrobacter marensis TaxID=543877 RepID=A0ABZ2D8K3_9SPHN